MSKNKNILESKRSRIFMLLTSSYYSKQVEEFFQHIHGKSIYNINRKDIPDIMPHEFKSSLFTIPTSCDLCGQFIWGISRPGLCCRGKELYVFIFQLV